MNVHVVDYGLSNLLSVSRAVHYVGHTPVLTTTPEMLQSARVILLPGVGAFRDGMAGLQRLGLADVLKEKAAGGTPLMGICLGMQMLLSESDETGLQMAAEPKTAASPIPGLGLIPGRVERIPPLAADGSRQRVPQVGWNVLLPPRGADAFTAPLLRKTPPGSEVYFVHSYEAKPADASHRLADTLYGGRRVCAAVGSGNVAGTQFHPEKSGGVGLAILEQFLAAATN